MGSKDTWRAEMRSGPKQANWLNHGIVRKSKPQPKLKKRPEPKNFQEAMDDPEFR